MFSEIKVGDYAGNVEDLLKIYGQPYIPAPKGRDDVEKYILQAVEGSATYLIMVSGCSHPERNYDIMVSCFSQKGPRAKKFVEDFAKKTGVTLRTAPQQVLELERIMRRIL
jgi:hypothetical protein